MKRSLPALALALAVAAPATADEFALFTIGAGPLGGGYHTAARAICDVVHMLRPGELRCSPDPTPGSVYNAQALGEGQLDFAIVQSDTHHHVVDGTGVFAPAGPNPTLRSVLSLYPEPLTFLVRRDAGIAGIGDLAGQRVNIGPRNSGTRATVLRLMDRLGLEEDDFAEARGLPMGAAFDQLCAGSLDAVLIVIGHPNATIARTLAECDVTLLPVTGAAIDDLVAESGDYTQTTIPRRAYPGLTGNVETYSVTATLMTRADVPPEIVTAVAGIVTANLPDLNRRAPVIPRAWAPGMASDGLRAPLYQGLDAILPGD